MGQLSLKYADLEASLTAIVHPDTVFELRLLAKGRKRVDGGYFDNVAAAADALSSLEQPYKGIYLTPNPVLPDVLARANNRITTYFETTTKDNEVVRRVWLLIDIDPKRPKDISSTNLEHARAMSLAREVSGMLELQYGWCQPMLNSSGNGAHLLYPINEPNDEYTTTAIKAFLKALAHRFDGAGCSIDTSVFNAARIWRLPGTYARKGDSTAERPHRKAEIVEPHDDCGLVTIEQIEEFTASNPVPVDKPASTRKVDPNKGQAIYRTLNGLALKNLEGWVLKYFPGAREYKLGYRITSEELGRDREEELSIQPYPIGITDFGEHDSGEDAQGKRTPVSIIAEFHYDGDLVEAAKALAETLGTTVTEFSNLDDEEAKEDKKYRDIFEEAAFNMSSIKSYTSLQTKTFKELDWIIPQVLPVGCFILAARPKMRKTWLALQLCVAASTGGKFLEWHTNKCKTLYLGLEDNERRIKKRIETLHTFDFELPDLSDFHYFTEGSFPRGDDGCDILRRYHDGNPDCKLVVVDTFAHFRKLSQERDVYMKDYQAVMPVTRLANERQLCIILVHHEKKGLAGMPSGDFLEDVNGSSGLTGGIDGVISIKGRRGVQEENESRKLLITGRDVPFDYELDMSFDAERGGWQTAARQDTKTLIKALFVQHPFMSQSEVAALLPNIPASRIRQCLLEMKFAGVLEQSKIGYKLRSN